MGTKKGNLSIDSENIFPIIKKWVYSDHDIFMRELVSVSYTHLDVYKRQVVSYGKVLKVDEIVKILKMDRG